MKTVLVALFSDDIEFDPRELKVLIERELTGFNVVFEDDYAEDVQFDFYLEIQAIEYEDELGQNSTDVSFDFENNESGRLYGLDISEDVDITYDAILRMTRELLDDFNATEGKRLRAK